MNIHELIDQNRAIHAGYGSATPNLSGITGSVEGFFRGLNLNTPLMRAAFVGGVTAGILNLWQPDVFFEHGAARPWEPFTDPATSRVQPTMVTWWIAAAFTGFAAGLFI